VPDVPIKASPALMRRWRKKAKPVYRNGVLIPWEDRDIEVVKGLGVAGV